MCLIPFLLPPTFVPLLHTISTRTVSVATSGESLPHEQILVLLLSLTLAAATECRGHLIRRWVTDCLTLIGCERVFTCSSQFLRCFELKLAFWKMLRKQSWA